MQQHLFPLACLLRPPLFLSFLVLQNDEINRNESSMDGQKSKDIALMLHNATSQTESFYGNDVKTAFQMISRVLQYESQQRGFDLAAMRDANFNEVTLHIRYNAVTFSFLYRHFTL